MAAKARTIKLPTTSCARSARWRAPERADAEFDRSPTDAEVAAEAQMSLDDLNALRDAARTVTSLDRPLGEEEDASFATCCDRCARP